MIPTSLRIYVCTGVTLETRDLGPDVEPGPGQRYVLQVDVPVDATRERNWVIFHARADGDLSPVHPGKSPYGVTNALYLVAE